ncbi:MAG TPA: hypothetical protein PLC86_22365 [Candidatus Accumulibacter phosphatis]|nr:hypothetical protein [Candidatus Accumulibacter phosphatis]
MSLPFHISQGHLRLLDKSTTWFACWYRFQKMADFAADVARWNDEHGRA